MSQTRPGLLRRISGADLFAGARGRLSRLPAPLARARYDFVLLTGRGLLLFVIVDALILISGVIDAAEAASGFDQATALYRRTVLLPHVLLSLPTLSAMLSLERRSGTLDLALSTRSVERYLARRALPIPLLMAVQGILVVWLLPAGPWFRLGASVLAVTIALLVASIAIFWSVRLDSSGAVMVASAATLVLFAPWAFYSPFPARGTATAHFHHIPVPLLGLLGNLTVLAGVTVLLLLYARRRLRRPETLL